MNRLQKFVEQGAYGGGSGAQRSPLANVVGWAQLQRSEFSPNARVRVLACFALNLAVA
jgi:hypothetical protein